jgi:hypothetical protein
MILINAHGQYRPDENGVIPVDVIMAIKLLTPQALAVNYIFDQDGEDVGWSRAATAQGLKLAFDGRVCSRHVMHQRDRDTGKLWSEIIDPRCGY